ncbi:ribosome hibernation-promoting factor, HPF/YfiA family [Parasphingorhabdus flavimaris]|jgi:ribosomal subunit interface protein|uniref:Ribosome hibernation promoting factor n=1 Tax=Parasphingorhabdus flavimaris TaxID=266812 RepID=A0ABX2N5A5_9SPHN|nr:ribosome-associated translation inhibitor RaiA [Parasphingorhabdus flavimaris]NVD28911.1 ribosome-associated translation inhibitor RaiA [Parasphingorhabdus flavimaris]|tara:strand:+ start:2046 stop:2621 length:576 start_codon:yes stop_codon:yes gene_type:complete
MEVRVSGHQVDTGDALQTHAEDRMHAIAQKYFPKALSANVTVSKAPHSQFKCDIVNHVMQGLMLKADAEAGDAHQAFEKAADKVEKQLRRYMRRLNDHHVQAQYAAKQEEAAYRVFESSDDDEEESEVNGDSPPIIAETSTDIPVTSVSTAVMMMDLRNTGALMFKNSGTGAHNMVYRRGDGTIGWVEPHS